MQLDLHKCLQASQTLYGACVKATILLMHSDASLCGSSERLEFQAVSYYLSAELEDSLLYVVANAHHAKV